MKKMFTYAIFIFATFCFAISDGVYSAEAANATVYPAVLELEAGPIWNHSDAQTKCPSTVLKYKNTLPENVEARWTGGWRTTIETKMSVCTIRIIDKSDWIETPISPRPVSLNDSNRCDVGYAFDAICAKNNKISNCWVYDDVCRDKLGMDATKLDCGGQPMCLFFPNENNDPELTKKNNHCRQMRDLIPTCPYIINEHQIPASIDDGRYIYVLRKKTTGPLTLVMRRYDRNFTLKNGKKCDFRRFRNGGNVSSIRTPDLSPHVRHSQLNEGWSPVWGAGEAIVSQGKVTIISNESGHFKPANKTLQYVQKAMFYLGIGDNVNTMNSPQDSISNLDEEFACMGGEIKNK